MLKEKKIIILIALCALVFRLCLFVIGSVKEERFLYADSIRYLTTAKGIIQNGIMKPDGNSVDMLSAPLYPLFCALLLKIFSSIKAIMLIQNLLGMIICILVYRLGKAVFGRKVGYIASFIYAVDILSVIHTNTLQTETLFTLFFISSIYLFILFLNKQKIKYLIFSSFLLGISVMTREVAMYFFLIGIISLIIKYSKKMKLLFSYAVLYMFIFLMLPFIWSYKNYIYTKTFALNYKAEIALYASIFSQSELAKTKGDYGEIWAKYVKEIDDLYNKYENKNIWLNELRKKISNKIISEPTLFIKGYTKGMIRMLINVPRAEFVFITGLPYSGRLGFLLDYADFNNVLNVIKQMHPIVILFVIYSLFINFTLLIFSLKTFFSFFEFNQKKKLLTCFLFLVVIYFVLLSTGSNAVSRFKVPIIPVLCILAGSGIYGKDI